MLGSSRKLMASCLTALALMSCDRPPKAPENLDIGDYSHVKNYMHWLIKKEMKEKNIVGLSIALIDDQDIVWSQGFGYADKENKIQATPQTRYRAGSVSKLFTALAAMQLEEQGKLDIDKPLVNYLPEFKIKSRFGSIDNITPRTLMTHHSGLPSNYSADNWARAPVRIDNIASKLKNDYVTYPVNTVFSYSNLGITLLGQLVENRSRQSFETYVNDNLLTPMRMRNSDFTGHLTGRLAAVGYRKGKPVTELPLGIDPAGGLNTDVTDLSRLVMMVNAGGKLDGKQIVQPQTLTRMFAPQNEAVALDMGMRIGLAWFFSDDYLDRDENVVGHDGGTMAHTALLRISLKSKLGIVLLSNSSEASTGFIDAIAKKLLRMAYDVKTGKTRQDSETNYVIAEENQPKLIEGFYATSYMGLFRLYRKAGKYKVKTMGYDFDLQLGEDNQYYMKYKLFGLFPLSLDGLEAMGLRTKVVNGHQLLVSNVEGMNTLIGTRVEPVPIPPKWRTRLGRYDALNNIDFIKAMGMSTSAELRLKDGFLVVTAQSFDGEVIELPLKPVNDDEAILMGLGRGLGETIYVRKIDGQEVLVQTGSKMIKHSSTSRSKNATAQ